MFKQTYLLERVILGLLVTIWPTRVNKVTSGAITLIELMKLEMKLERNTLFVKLLYFIDK